MAAQTSIYTLHIQLRAAAVRSADLETDPGDGRLFAAQAHRRQAEGEVDFT